MTQRPTATLRSARATARRAGLADAVRLGGRGLVLGAVVAGIAVSIDKLAGGPSRWPLLIGASMALAIVGAGALIVLRRWSLLRAAEEIDHRLGLNDALSSAVELGDAGKGSDAWFVDWTIQRAEAAAVGVDPSKVVPIRWDWSWIVWPVALAGSIALALFAPAARWDSPARSASSPEQAAARQAAAGQLQEVVQSVEDVPELGEAAAEEELRELRELHEELIAGTADAEQASIRAAQELQQLAGKLDERTERERLGDELLQDQMATAAAQHAGGEDQSGSSLMQALQRRDLAQAGSELEQLSRDLERMTQEEREQFALELESLARALEPQDEPLPEGDSDTPSETAPAPGGGEPGEPEAEQAGEPSPEQPPPSREELERALREQGLSPEEAQREAEQRMAAERRRQAEEAAQREVEELRRSLEDAARELRGEQPQGAAPPPPPPPDGRQPAAAQEQEQPAQGQRPDQPSAPEAQPGAQSEPKQPAPQGSPGGEKNPEQTGEPRPKPPDGTAGEPKPGEQQAPQPQPAPGTKPSQQPQPSAEPRSRDIPNEQAPSPEQQRQGPQPSQGWRPSQEQQSPPGQQRQQPPQQQPGQQQQGQQEGAKPDGQDPQTPQDSQSPREPGATEPDPSSPSGVEGLARKLQKMAGQGQKQQQMQHQSERMRQMAQRMLQNASPEERQRLSDLERRSDAEQLGGAGAGMGPRPHTPDTGPSTAQAPAQTEPVDVRRRPQAPPRERVIAEWFSDQPAERSGTGTARPAPDESFAEAYRSIERSFEQQPVPPRYSDLVKRVFKRYADEEPARP